MQSNKNLICLDEDNEDKTAHNNSLRNCKPSDSLPECAFKFCYVRSIENYAENLVLEVLKNDRK